MQGTFNSYRIIWLCHTKLTPKYRDYVSQVRGTKQVFHLRSPRDITEFYKSVTTLLSEE
ncbi:MAG: hypothetical protein AAF685_12585 [Cyanobacteria bacterium P01_C01_bin.89]